MAFELTPKEQQRRQELEQALASRWAEVEDAIREIARALEDANVAIDAFNKVKDEAVAWAAELKEDRQAEYDDRSDAWKAGEQGTAAADWLAAWGDLEEVDLDDLEVSEVSEPYVVEQFASLPGAAE
jgi:hypothetical protein